MDSRLTTKAPHGQQIALTCKNHPDLRWSNKNIAPLGCRKIFFNLMNEPMGPECDCHFEELVVIPIEGPDVPE